MRKNGLHFVRHVRRIKNLFKISVINFRPWELELGGINDVPPSSRELKQRLSETSRTSILSKLLHHMLDCICDKWRDLSDNETTSFKMFSRRQKRRRKDTDMTQRKSSALCIFPKKLLHQLYPQIKKEKMKKGKKDRNNETTCFNDRDF